MTKEDTSHFDNRSFGSLSVSLHTPTAAERSLPTRASVQHGARGMAARGGVGGPGFWAPKVAPSDALQADGRGGWAGGGG